MRALWTGLLAAVAALGMSPTPSYAGPVGGGVIACDLDGDDITDVGFEGSLQGVGDNLIAAWITANLGIESGGGFPNADSYDVKGCGKFDDNNTDDFVNYNTSGGDIVLFLMNGLTLTSGLPVGNAGANQPWIVGDFNNDGETDILLFNPATSDISVWLLTNGVFTGGGFVGAPAGWTPKAAGDFDGDGDLDLLLYNTTTQQYAVWYLEDLGIVTGTGGDLPGFTFLESTANVNGDNIDDIGLRDGDGNFYWWLIGFPGGVFAITGTIVVGDTGTAVPLATGEFNGDDDTDLLLQDPANGDVFAYTLQSGGFLGGGLIGGPLINPPALNFIVVNNGQ
jgi:hypothetical protein